MRLNMKTLVSYLRVSTDRQGIRGLGMEAQREAVARYAESVQARVIAEYIEVESGRRCDRPQLARALAHARRDGAILCVAKLDRLGRSVRFLSALMESKCEFVCCDMPSANRFVLHIMAAVAEHEAQIISQRVKAALKAFQANKVIPKSVRDIYKDDVPEGELWKAGKLGFARSGYVPGKEARDKSALTRQAQARTANLQLRPELEVMRSKGMSLAAIAERLNLEGRLTRRGKRWYPMTVWNVLAKSASGPSS